MPRMTGTLHEDRCTFMTVSRGFLLSMRDDSDKYSTENQNTLFMFNNFFLNRKICEVMWENLIETDRTQMTI